jgi:hypothetical protein
MKPFRQYLNELRVGAAFKKGGIRGAVHALKANIKNRGVIGGSGLGDNSIAAGGAHGGAHNRIERERKAGKHKDAAAARRKERVWGHYKDKINRENEKYGVKPAYPERTKK